MSKTRRKIPLTQERRRELKTFTGSGKLLKWADIILALDTREGRKPAKEVDSAGHSRASALCMLTLYAVKNYDFSPEK